MESSPRALLAEAYRSSATETTITKVGKDVYVTCEEAEADVAMICK